MVSRGGQQATGYGGGEGALFQKELGVAPQDMYIRYLATPDWGWNGGNF